MEQQSSPYPAQAAFAVPSYPAAAQPASDSSHASLVPPNQQRSQEAFSVQFQPSAPISYPPQVIAPGQAVSFAPISGGQNQIWTTASQMATCPYCQASGFTVVRFEPGAVTWLSCMGICLLGGWAGCCLLPFCIPPLQDCIHMCASCGRPLGKRALI